MSGLNQYQFFPPEAPFADMQVGPATSEGWNILRENGYGAFEVFFRSRQGSLENKDLGALYFLRGILKQYQCDPTTLEDLEKAEALLPEPILLSPDFLSCLGGTPNLLRRIRPRPSSLFKHRVAVEKSGPILERLTQNPLCRMICSVMVAEIFYMNGKISQAVSIASPIYSAAEEKRHLPLRCYAGFVLMRCAVIMGDAVWFREILDSAMNPARPSSQLREVIKQIFGWINGTTGYLGIAPRYTALPNGIEIPNIDARVAYRRELNMGNQISTMPDPTSAADNLPIELADVYTHLFHAMMFYKHCEPDEAVRHFAMAGAITLNNRIYMPFAEYGDQIVPLLRYAMKEGAISRFQMNKLEALAMAYEKGLRATRDEVADYERTGMPEGLFTQAEAAVLRLICEGKDNEEIAATLGNRPNTVSELARRVFRKMHVDNRKEAIDKATHKRYFP